MSSNLEGFDIEIQYYFRNKRKEKKESRFVYSNEGEYDKNV